MKSSRDTHTFIFISFFHILIVTVISVIITLITSCFAFDQEIADAVKWNNTEVAANISDYTHGSLLIVPYFYTLKGDNRFKRTSTVVLTQSLTWLLTDNVKMRVKRVRPNKEDDRSFFSGHSSSAFVGAGLLCTMKKHCTEALVVAGLTGYLRMAADKHYLSDVVIGAGIGYAFGRYIPTVVVEF